MNDTMSWQALRSDIYIRDKGICWICNTFVDLRDYDLGHLVDRCNGGHDDYDNLAVMHKSCNNSKPYHSTLEEAVKWKLTSFIPVMKQGRGIPSRLPEVNYRKRGRPRKYYVRQNRHNTRGNPKPVRCIKSDPPMVGFGRSLQDGDIVTIDGTVHHEIGFAVSVPSECAFYAYDAFEPTGEFFNA